MIIENSVYQFEINGERVFERVLWIDKNQKMIVVVRLSEDRDKLHLPEYRSLSEFEDSIKDGGVKRTIDPFERSIDPKSDFYKKHVEKRDLRWERIKELAEDKPDIFDPNLRGLLIKELSNKTKISTRTYYQDLKQYWNGGQTIDALLPLYENSGAKGKQRIITNEMIQSAEKEGITIPKRGRKTSRRVGVNVDENILKIIKKSVEEFYQTMAKPTVPEAYQYMLENYFNVGFVMKDGIPTPNIDPKGRFITLESFKYYLYKDQDLRRTIIKREGQNRFNKDHRPVLKSSTNDQMAPGSVFQIDATQADVYLVNRYDTSRILKRPTIYAIQDVFSRLILGVYVRINAPSGEGIQLALFEAFKNTKLYSSFSDEEEINHETCLLPKVLLPDNGSEFISINSDFLSESSLGIRITNAPPYRADWKGIVEQTFNMLNKKIRMLPGAVKKGHKERGEPDHRGEALLNIDDFRSVLDGVVRNYNYERLMKGYKLDEQMTKDGVKPIPIEIWKWGIQNRGADLREMPLKNVMLNLLPRGEATVKQDGIYFQNRSYSSSIAEDQQWMIKAGFGSWKVPVVYDQRNASTLYMVLDNGQTFEPCYLLERDRRYREHTLDEIEDLDEKEKELKYDYEVKERQSEADLNALIDNLVKNKVSKEEAVLKAVSNTKRIKGINENTQIARNEEKLEEAEKINNILMDQNKSNNEFDDDQLDEKLEEFLSKEQSIHRKLMNY